MCPSTSSLQLGYGGDAINISACEAELEGGASSRGGDWDRVPAAAVEAEDPVADSADNELCVYQRLPEGSQTGHTEGSP